MTPNFEETFRFLQAFRPGGPWVLNAIQTNGQGLWLDQVSTKEEVLQWLMKHNQSERNNCYFQVNSTSVDMFTGLKKLGKQHISTMDYLHVDIDARKGHDAQSEMARIASLIGAGRPAGVPGPTFTVMSGGGFQCFWKLTEPVQLSGDEGKCNEAALYNEQLERLLGADACHNVDRIMRLPGTVNWPSPVKQRRGRLPVVAELIDHQPISYPLEAFKKAPKIQGPAEFSLGAGVQISGNIRPMETVDELPVGVTDKLKQIIVNGCDPDSPERFDGDRSRAVFYVTCALAREPSVTDDMIYSVLTSPEFVISGHVLAQPRPEAYAKRQIEKARLKSEPNGDMLLDFNEKFAVIHDVDGGRCRVMRRTYQEAMDRENLSFQTFGDFQNSTMNRLIHVSTPDGKDIYMPAGKWWLSHAKRREYQSVIFNPGKEVPGYYNLWEGFAVEPRQGNWSMLREHMFQNVCRGDHNLYTYLYSWLARCVQVPNEPGHTAIVLRGRQGTGKSFLANAFGRLWGRHYMMVNNVKHVLGQFNGHLQGVVFLFGDEAFSAGEKQHESTLKTLVTEDKSILEKKGVDAQVSKNFLHLMLASNDEWVIPAGMDDRRFFVLDIGERNIRDSEYFTKINDQLENGGLEAMLWDLLNKDLKEFRVRDVPSTKAHQEQKLLSMGSLDSWWYSKMCEGYVLHDKEWADPLPVQSVVRSFRQETGDQRMSSIQIGKYMTSIGATRIRSNRPLEYVNIEGKLQTGDRVYCYVLPDRDEAMRSWHTRTGVDAAKVEVPDLTDEEAF